MITIAQKFQPDENVSRENWNLGKRAWADASADDKIDIPLKSLELMLSISSLNRSRYGDHAFQDGNSRRDENVIKFEVSERKIRQCREYFQGMTGGANAENYQIAALQDPVVGLLKSALERAQASERDVDGIYADTVRLAMVTRILNLHLEAADKATSRRGNPLQKWRMKRLTDYVESNYAEPITLAGMAKVAGLSRMHFAAQFRAATGMSPREYVMKRRIEMAQQMLSHTAAKLVEIALNVGFQNQAHFTTVFKRFSGTTPQRWRAQCRNMPVIGPPVAANSMS